MYLSKSSISLLFFQYLIHLLKFLFSRRVQKEVDHWQLVSEMQGQKKMLDLQNALPGMERGLQVIMDQHSDRSEII